MNGLTKSAILATCSSHCHTQLLVSVDECAYIIMDVQLYVWSKWIC